MPIKVRRLSPEAQAKYMERFSHLPHGTISPEARARVDALVRRIDRGDDFYTLEEWAEMTPEQKAAARAKSDELEKP